MPLCKVVVFLRKQMIKKYCMCSVVYNFLPSLPKNLIGQVAVESENTIEIWGRQFCRLFLEVRISKKFREKAS